jgi:hypothetical protein
MEGRNPTKKERRRITFAMLETEQSLRRIDDERDEGAIFMGFRLNPDTKIIERAPIYPFFNPI